MQFPIGFFEVLVLGAIVLAIGGALLLATLFLVDSRGKRLW
jgi:hypothetical protein